jgi:hypothetical protein
MTQQFQDQGGAATMDPTPFVRWLTSTIMTRLSRPSAIWPRISSRRLPPTPY